MINFLRSILLGMLSLFAMAGCDVHEIPDINEEPVAFSLHLDFDTDLPFYDEVVYTRTVQESKALATHDVRYVVKAYREEGDSRFSRVAHDTFIFTSSDIHNLNRTLQLALPEGNYIFKVWVDYIDKGTTADKYYDTGDFAEIILADRANHPGSNDYRDAFRGSVVASIVNPDYYTGSALTAIDNQAWVEMKRPMGKFKFISTDLEAFVTRVARSLADQGVIDRVDSKATYDELLQLVSLDDYEIVFRYNIFMPCSFNMFTDKPADSWTGMSFKSLMHNESNKEITLGFDYIFVNGSETTLSISVEVYNPEGEKLSASKPVDVPIVRSKLTIVRGEFLTSEASGGVAINPDFDGPDYNIEIK